mmetsp:Transcript_17193/g.16642  ORF Transcript_17193/g.16642 Transcript_17193/m.16642 type:complete len:437 (-) Transcript_17193:62-1372(-)|eukprot:CAMPEP_0197826418 /NCGR_PEP_ID=MMETSP1437-20131217/3379_1 /TAXON_ID=49252 ORGANISM="Eucampia antarctica, Strain CCMP1452" /NCGR_SAMPLE_ID=MMETSP1437 /ASSEMBLY_ACC=CAM_ASM_001096 /LENGTH=436 /DNA_ID=CAMNT_0043426845 /DNA_START=101 /DNA_END=1411 /DNA_ORIENTATION=+
MEDYDYKAPDNSHPDALIRIVSTVLRFKVPKVGEEGQKLCFANSLRSVGSNPKTQAVLKKADLARKYMITALSADPIPHKTTISAAQKYIPLMNQILLSCRVQPEAARLDERLFFQWSSGIEHETSFFTSEAMMYEVVMAVAVEAMATAGLGCDLCTDGDFAAASREFKKASGMFEYLNINALPNWIARGSDVMNNDMPAEGSLGATLAFKTLYLAIGQQMAVATVLMKPGTPNYSLLAKLCLGIADYFEVFVDTLRSKAPRVKEKMDCQFFTLVTFQIQLQKALTYYFLARHTWDLADDYGLAITMLNEAKSMLATRTSPTSPGLPKISSKSPLKALEADLTAVKIHFTNLLREWEKDNSTVYFSKVLSKVPEEKRLTCGVQIIKPEPYSLAEVDPLPLVLPGGNDPKPPGQTQAQMQSDEELARQLQESLNTSD